MTTTGKSILVQQHEEGTQASLVEVAPDHVADGNVLVDVQYSSLNYKDAMALEGNKGVARTLPLVPGIDVVGTVVESDSDRFQPGDQLILNGAGLGEFRHGGYTAQQRVPADSAVKLPEQFTAHQAAAIGTAGFTAAMSINALLDHNVKPEDGPILVTGASGGVGSIAIHLLHTLGYEVHASTGRADEHGDYLRELGATEIVDRATLSERGKPLQRATYAGAVDCIGSHTLVNACAQVKWGGVVTACGLAQGADLPGTVLPFILRGVVLAGINSVDAPLHVREAAWKLLANQVDTHVLDRMTITIPLADVIVAGQNLMSGKIHGRTVVEI
ncbi:MDR family oxidoreductase [Staphylococcus chromogenes]|nr:MDR family oxidoreductase [Staphylococcus chromogenes]